MGLCLAPGGPDLVGEATPREGDLRPLGVERAAGPIECRALLVELDTPVLELGAPLLDPLPFDGDLGGPL